LKIQKSFLRVTALPIAQILKKRQASFNLPEFTPLKAIAKKRLPMEQMIVAADLKKERNAISYLINGTAIAKPIFHLKAKAGWRNCQNNLSFLSGVSKC